MTLAPLILVTGNLDPGTLDALNSFPCRIREIALSDLPDLLQREPAADALLAGVESQLPETIDLPVVRVVPGESPQRLAESLRHAAAYGRERRRVRLISQLTSRIHQAENAQQVMQATCQVVVSLFEIDHSGFVDFDDARRMGWKQCEYPETRNHRESIQVLGIPAEEQVVLAGRIFASPTIAGDAQLGQVGEHLLSKGIQAILIVPVLAGGQVIGSFSLDSYDSPRTFSQEEIDLALQLANQVGIALHNLRRAEVAEGLRNAQRALQQIARRSVQGNLRETLQEIVDLARSELKVHTATLYTYDQALDRFLVDVGAGDNLPDSRIRPEAIGRESSLYRLLSLFPERLHDETDDAPNHPTFRGGYVTRENIRSSFGMVLTYEDQPVGIFFINFREVHRFRKEEIETFQQFGHQAAVLIETARLKERWTGQLRTLKALYDPGGVVDQDRATQEQTLEHIAVQALAAVGLTPETGVSHIAVARQNRLSFVAASSPEVLEELRARIGEIDLDDPNSRRGVVGRTFQDETGRPQNITNTAQDLDHIKFRADLHSQLSVLLRVGGHKLGVLSVESVHPYAFTSEEVLNLEHLATHADLVLQNFRHLRLLDSLVKSGRVLHEQRNIWESLQSLADLLLESFDCDLVSIYPYNPELKEIVYPGILAGSLLDESRRTNPRLRPRRGRVEASKLIEAGVLKAMLENSSDVFCSEAAQSHDLLGRGEFVTREAIQASAGVHLVSGRNKLVGLLFLSFRRPHAFTDAERMEISVFAHSLAEVIDHFNQYDQLRQSQGRVGLLNAYQWMNWLARERDAQTRAGLFDLVERLAVVQRSLSQDPGRDPDLVELVETGRQKAQRLARALETPAEVRRETISFQKLVQDHLVQGLDPAIADRLQIEIAGFESLDVQVDPDWLRHGLNQLLSLLIDRPGERVKVTVSAKVEDGQACLHLVHDRGDLRQGILPATQAGQAPTAYPWAIADAIARLFDGSLEFLEGPGAQTTFRLCLPIAQEDSPAAIV